MSSSASLTFYFMHKSESKSLSANSRFFDNYVQKHMSICQYVINLYMLFKNNTVFSYFLFSLEPHKPTLTYTNIQTNPLCPSMTCICPTRDHESLFGIALSVPYSVIGVPALSRGYQATIWEIWSLIHLCWNWKDSSPNCCYTVGRTLLSEQSLYTAASRFPFSGI